MKLTVSRHSSPPPRLGEGTTIADRFRLVRQIGEGGMGSVWLATHLGLGIPCAVKFVEGEWRRQPEMVARFEREAKVEAQLRSPHVVHVLDHGVWSGTPYIVMELLQGESVAQRLDRVTRLGYAATHRLVAHVSRALTRAHAIGIVHRDLKPENIYLVPDDDGEIAKVLDFGVAKWSSDWAVSSVTKTGLLVGTPLYMSPEQARGTKEIDFRADLWSLAVMTYQALTGELPFLSEGLGDLLAKIMFEPIPLPSSIVPTLPPEFDAWWARASSRDIESRFQSAKELADALAVALDISAPTTVAEVPAGFREAALSDYSLSMGDDSSPPQRSASPSFWPGTRSGKLLGGGILGVVAIAATMSLRPRDERKTPQTLVSPTASVSSAQTSQTSQTAAPADSSTKPELSAKPSLIGSSKATEPAPEAVKGIEHDAPPKAEKPEEAGAAVRRRPSVAPPPVQKPVAKPPTTPGKPKVDFGI